MPQLVVFDLFDTLVDLRWEDLPLVDWGEGPKRSTLAALHALVAPLGGLSLPALGRALREADEAFLRARWAQDREITTEQRFADLVERLGLEADGLVERLTATHLGALARVSTAPAHHRSLLERIARTHTLAICSNYSHTPTARSILEREGLLDAFEAVVVSADVGWRKPHRRIFEQVLGDLGASPADGIHVGDSLAKDVAGAAAIGLETVWITRRIEDPDAAFDAYDGPRPDHVIEDLAELEALLA